MAVTHPWWKKWLCYLSCEWFTKPVFGKRLCVCAYDVLGVKKKVKREYKGKDGGFPFFRRPWTIALIGLDGSGKTTQAKNIMGFLKERGIKAKYVHLPCAVPLSKACNVSGISTSVKKKRRAGFFVTSGRQAFYLVGIVWIYLFTLFPSWLRGNIVVCDRWFYDEHVHMCYKNMCYLPDLMKGLTPRPAMLIYLKIDPKTAFERAKEADLRYFTSKEKLYERFSDALKVQVTSLESTKEKVLDAVSSRLG